MPTLDCAIIGGGPAALAVAASLEKENLSYCVFERNHIGFNVARFPICMRFFSSRELVEIDNFALTIPDEKPTREQYLNYLIRFAKSKEINVKDYTKVTSVVKKNRNVEDKNKEFFELTVKNYSDQQTTKITATTVVTAIGALDHPQKLNVEGESLPHVSAYFQEVYPYIGHKVLVVGSGNGAVETALLLHRAGAQVSLSYRTPELDKKRIKYWMYPDISKRLEKKEIEDLRNTVVEKISTTSVFFKSNLDTNNNLSNNKEIKESADTGPLQNKTEDQIEKEFDFVVLQTGYEPPIEFLTSMDIEIDPKTKIPNHNEKTLETNIPGVFIAGAIVGGNVSGKVFIENSRHHGELIAPRIKEIVKKS